MKYFGLPRSHILVGKKVTISPTGIATRLAQVLVYGVEGLAHRPSQPFGGSASMAHVHGTDVHLLVEKGD